MRRLSVRVATVAAAVAGVVVAHSVGALLAFSDGHQRAEHLAVTGHGYWPAAVRVALGAGAVAVAWAAVGGARTRTGVDRPITLRFSVLAPAQVGLFAAVEVVERLVAGASLADLRHGVAFPVGLLVQVATAGVLTVLLRRLHRLAARVAAHLRGRPRLRRTPAPWPRVGHILPLSTVAGRVRSRAPPPAAATRPA